MDERYYWAGMSGVDGIGPVRYKLLLSYFGTAEAVWKAKKEELLKVGLSFTLVERLLSYRASFDFEKFSLELSKNEISFLTLKDELYPPRLREITDPPFVLFVRGMVKKEDWDSAFGVVGTRKMTAYGKEVTERIVGDLVVSGVTIISGMARGVDGVAHRVAIENGGRTIAVLGCGVDIIYPPDNRDLYYKILQNGAVISEIAPGKRVERGAFPARNRIISGISQGVLVCEGKMESGSLITAKDAADQGREVFAIPGPITSVMSEGPSYLISQGAKVVTKASDILEELGISKKVLKKYRPVHKLSSEEEKIVEMLQIESLTIDEIVRMSGLNSGTISTLVTGLELSGGIKRIGNKFSAS